MKKKSEKQKDLDALRKELEKTGNLFVSSFDKLTVAQDFELRKTVRGVGGRYKVIKNNLAEKAAEGTPSASVLRDLKGMTSISYGKDPVALAKALTAYARTTPTFTFKAGLVEGRAIDVKSIQELSTMPPREEILAKVLFMINATAQRTASVIAGVGRNLAVVLDQAAKENKFKA